MIVRIAVIALRGIAEVPFSRHIPVKGIIDTGPSCRVMVKPVQLVPEQFLLLLPKRHQILRIDKSSFSQRIRVGVQVTQIRGTLELLLSGEFCLDYLFLD